MGQLPHLRTGARIPENGPLRGEHALALQPVVRFVPIPSGELGQVVGPIDVHRVSPPLEMHRPFGRKPRFVLARYVRPRGKVKRFFDVLQRDTGQMRSLKFGPVAAPGRGAPGPFASRWLHCPYPPPSQPQQRTLPETVARPEKSVLRPLPGSTTLVYRASDNVSEIQQARCLLYRNFFSKILSESL